MTSDKTPVSDELLNTLLDGEIDGPEYEALRGRIAQDPELARRAREILRLKQLVRLARPGEDGIPARRTPSRRRSWGAYAALALLALAGLVALALHDRPAATQAPEFAAVRAQFAQAPVSGAHNIVVHARRGDAAALQVLLDELERYIARAERAGGSLNIEVVADGAGLTLLRADASPVVERIRALKQRHKNLVFVACNRTRSRLEREGHSVSLLPEAKVVHSVQEQITQRTRQGWNYLAV